jgi:hypothetical protein
MKRGQDVNEQQTEGRKWRWPNVTQTTKTTAINSI